MSFLPFSFSSSTRFYFEETLFLKGKIKVLLAMTVWLVTKSNTSQKVFIFLFTHYRYRYIYRSIYLYLHK